MADDETTGTPSGAAEEEATPSGGVIEGVQLGAAPSYSSGAMTIDERGVVTLEPAPMPQFQMVVDQGLEPTIPEDTEGFGFEEYLNLDTETRAAVAQRKARAEADEGETPEPPSDAETAGAGNAGTGTGEGKPEPVVRKRTGAG